MMVQETAHNQHFARGVPFEKKQKNKEKQRVEENIPSSWTVPTTPAGALSESLTTVHHKRDKQQRHSQTIAFPMPE